MKKHNEIFIITMEECGELIQACSKVIRTGAKNPHQDKLNNLSDEVGDVLCMIDLLIEGGYLKPETLEQRKLVKRQKLKKYSGLFDEPTNTEV